MVRSEVIQIENMSKQFGKLVVLREVNFLMKKGEILGLLGPSGSGKTTLVKAIVGMGAPTSGEVKVLGQTMPSLSVVNQIGYMAQSDALYEDLSGLDNLLFFGSLYGWRGKEARKRAEEVLKIVDLSEHGRRAVRDYSGGMKRRLSLATALFHQPDLLILDEPTVGIDPVLRKEFWKEFHRLRDKGVSILITTHVMDEAENCDRLALIRDGGIIAMGTPSELKEHSGTESINDAFLYYGTKEGGQNNEILHGC